MQHLSTWMTNSSDMEPIEVIWTIGGEEWLITLSRSPQDKLDTFSQEVHHLLPNREKSSRVSLNQVKLKSKGSENDKRVMGSP